MAPTKHSKSKSKSKPNPKPISAGEKKSKEKTKGKKRGVETSDAEDEQPRRSSRHKSKDKPVEKNQLLSSREGQSRKRAASTTSLNEKDQKKPRNSKAQNSTRRAPAVIDESESEQENVKSKTPPTKQSKAVTDEHEEVSSGAEEDNNDEGTEEQEETDLKGMKADKLKKAILAESAQFSVGMSTQLKKNSSASPATAPGSALQESESLSHSLPSKPQHKAHATSRKMIVSESESESKSDDSSRSSDSGSDSSGSDSGSESGSRLHDDDDDEVNTKVSKRGLARRQEKPQWKESSSIKDPSRKRRTNLSKESCNHGWPVSAHYTPPQTRLLSLKQQPAILQRVLQGAIHEVIGDAMFDQAYPDVGNQTRYFRDVVKKCAHEKGEKEIARRCKKDPEFLGHIQSLLSARIGLVRSKVKGSISAASIQSFYQLDKSSASACTQRVEDLTSVLDYIYPMDPSGKAIDTQPFQHPAIIWTLKEHFFGGSRGSLANKYASRFSSSIDKGPEKNVLEVPIAMLCLVATGIHAVLDEWSTGLHNSGNEFKSDHYSSVYKTHEEFLGMIKDEDERKYHHMMANIYNQVAPKQNHVPAAVASKALTRLNLAGMAD